MSFGEPAERSAVTVGASRRIRVTLPWLSVWDKKHPPKWFSYLGYGWFMAIGVTASVSALAVAHTSRTRGLQAGLALLGFGLAVIAVAQLLIPRQGKHARLSLRKAPRTHETGTAICCSRVRTGILFAVFACLTEALLASRAAAEAPGWAVTFAAAALLAGLAAALFGYGAVRGQRFILTPDHVTIPFGRFPSVPFGRSSSVAWEAIKEVIAAETFGWARVGVGIYGTAPAPSLDRYLALLLTGRHIADGPVKIRTVSRGREDHAVIYQLKIPVDLTGIAPAVVLYRSLRYYLGHKEDRAELARPFGLERMAQIS